MALLSAIGQSTLKSICRKNGFRLRMLSTQSTSVDELSGPLAGVRVIEVGNFIAGPFCGTLLAYYGAEVIKIEPPGGDQVRTFRDVDENGTGWWWRSIGRNKKTVTLDLKKEGAQDIVLRLCKDADVLLENFRPGKLEQWNIGPSDVKNVNNDIIYTRVSGFGQTGPYASRPGFASACEAMGGFRYVNGFPDRPSVRPNLSIGDTLAGMNAAFGTVMALFAKQKGKGGQTVDSAIYESVFQLMEGVLCDYDGAGLVREPSGSTVTGIVPTNTYPTKDGKAVVIGSNSDALFKRLMAIMDRQDLADSELYDSNQKRVVHQEFLDKAIGEWCEQLTADEVMAKVNEAAVPNGLIYSIEDIVADPQYNARGMIEEVEVPALNRTLKIPGISPKLDVTPGKTVWAGPEIGAHSFHVFKEIMNMTDEQILSYVDNGDIIWPEDQMQQLESMRK